MKFNAGGSKVWWFLLLLLLKTALAAVEVEGIRYQSRGEKLRIVLDLSERPRYRAFLLERPDRLVVDLKGGRARRGLSRSGYGIVKRVRRGYPKPGTFRLVFDLKGKVRFSHFRLGPKGRFGHRIVLDLRPLKRPSASRKRRGRRRELLVAIDAGHGGRDTGAIGPTGLKEKWVTLQIARALEWLVDRDRRMEGVLIRKRDRFLPLPERVARAKRLGADLFVSIHADGHRDRSVRGASVFVYDPRRGLRPVAYRRYDPRSHRLAREILQEMRKIGKLHFPWVERRRYYVLAGPMPSVLVEVGFITNPREERLLRQRGWRWRIAEAIYRGIRDYVRRASR